MFPALIALVSLYGLFVDPATIAAQIESATSALPDQARELITAQVNQLASRSTALGVTAILGIAIALFSASGGMANLMTAINAAYDEERSGVSSRSGCWLSS